MEFPVSGGSVLVMPVVEYLTDSQGKLLLDDKGNKQLALHGYVRQYHLYTDLIRQQFQTMFHNGQRRLGIAVAFKSGGDGFALDSSTGVLQGLDGQNLAGLIQDAIEAGFAELLIEIIPEWDMSYAGWIDEQVMGAGNTRSFDPLKYGLLLSFINSVWHTAVAAAAGKVPIWLDLFGECGDATVGARLWSDWCILHPDPQDPATALGFSMVVIPQAVDLLDQFYANGNKPRVLNMHPYFGAAEMPLDQFKQALRAKGYTQGFIYGETNCNDPATAAKIAADTAGLFWILQWPVIAGVTPPYVTQDRLVVDYDAYQKVNL